MITVTLTSYNMGENVTEHDYLGWVGFVQDNLSDRVGTDVEVEAAPFGRGPAEDRIVGVIAVWEPVKEALIELWDDWCSFGWNDYMKEKVA